MVCPSCKHTIADDTLICPHCNNRVAALIQSQKLDKMRKEHKYIVADIFKSKPALILSIIMSVITLLYFINILINLVDISSAWNVIAIILFPGLLVSPIITTVFSWKLFANKRKLSTETIKGVKSFSAFSSVIFRILLVVATIIGVLLLIGIILLIVAMIEGNNASIGIGNVFEAIGLEDSGLSSLLSGSETAGFIVFIVLTAVFYVIFLYCIIRAMTTYMFIGLYYDELSQIYTTGEFNQDVSLPCSHIYVLGGAFATLAVFSIVFFGVSLAILLVGNALYLIFSAIFFKNAEQMLMESKQKYQTEYDKMVEINEKTGKLQKELDKKRRNEELQKLKQEQLEAQRKEAEEREREEIKQKLREQKLMKEMMQEILLEEKTKNA